MFLFRAFTSAEDDELAVRIFIVHANIIVYALAYWLTQPIMPFLAEALGADTILFGYLQSSFSVMQLIGGPIVGRLCDTRGPRIALLMSQLAASCMYLLLAGASNVYVLFASQLPTIFLHCMHAAQAAITLLSEDRVRAASLGRLTLSYGIGMMLGSLLGGSLGQTYGYHFVAMVAAILSFGMIPINLTYLPQGVAKVQGNKETNMGIKSILQLLKVRAVFDLIVLQLCVGMGLSVYRSSLSQALRLKFEFSPQEIGRLMSFGGILSILSNVVVVPFVTAKMSEGNALLVSISSLSLCFLLYSIAHTLWGVLAITIPMSITSSLVYTIFSSSMTKVVSTSDSGTSIGLSHATRTLCGIVAPPLGGYLLQDLGFPSLGYFGASAAALAVLYAYLSRTAQSLVSAIKSE